MNVPNKFIKILSEEDYIKLVENQQKSENFRVRNRSHAILLSFEKYSIDEIARICGVHRNTVSRWIERWNEGGWQGLGDVEKNGRPPILTLEEQARTVEIALENPKFPHRQLSRIKAETGKTISAYTLKRVIKKRLDLEKNQVGIVETDRRR
jgi:transposase